MYKEGITVGLPMYRSKYIGWLALEGLCRQEDIPCEWELVIEEEKEPDSMGEEAIRSYERGLYDVGCTHIKYISLDRWVALATKWSDIISVGDYSIFTLLGADMYPPKHRLYNIYEAFRNDIDLYGIQWDVMYDIKTEEFAMYKQPPKGSGMSLLTEYAKRIKPSKVAATVDQWIFNNYKELFDRDINIYIDGSDVWKYGFNTNGFNNISNTNRRSDSITSHKGSFQELDFDIRENVPLEILDKLVSHKVHLQYHKDGRI